MKGSIFPYKTSKYIWRVILFRVPAPRPRPISEFLPKFQNVAQTSQYIVKFALPVSPLRSFLRRKGVNDRFIAEDIGLLCSDAVLPGSALASVDARGDFQGVIEKFAHTRNFTQMNLEFYVDNDYKILKFFEHYIEFITGSSAADPTSDTYHFRLNFPSDYKMNETRIVKFERDYNRFLEYRFIGLFPLSLQSTRVSYQGSSVLKANVTFSFDRYICGESTSLVRNLKRAFNDIFGRGNPAKNGSSLSFDQLSSVFNSGSDTDNKAAKLSTLNNGSISSQVANYTGQSLGYGNYVSPGSNIDFG